MITKRKMNPQSKKKVLVGMSGGVDSSVAVALLQEQGYEVVGATMLVLKEDCRNNSLEKEAKEVAQKLGIEHISLHLENAFDEKVIQYFISEYQMGRTPNPCVLCNRVVKFEELLKKAKELDIPYIATGHYARVEEKSNRYILKRSVSKTKDQSYMLYNLTQDQLSHTIFPLGKYNKDDVRDLARKYSLNVADKKDSQEICFIEDNSYTRFLKQYSDSELEPGDFVNTNGEVIGEHRGIAYYTVGQRKGLDIASNKPMYVVDIDLERNRIVVGDEKDLLCKELVATNLNWIAIEKLSKEMKIEAKIRYGAKESDARIFPLENNNVRVEFETPQRAITPGQAVVFYDGDTVVGGGTIL